MFQEEEYRERQYGEVDRKGEPKQEEAEGLQAHGELIGSSSMDVPDLGGRGVTLVSGYFDAAGNWQTYDITSSAKEPSTSRYCTCFCTSMWEWQHSMFECSRWPGILGMCQCTLLTIKLSLL